MNVSELAGNLNDRLQSSPIISPEMYKSHILPLSSYLKEAYKFLEQVFDNLRAIHMREELIKDVYFGTYQHIGFSFMEKVIDERIISVNMGALHQMSLGLVINADTDITDPRDKNQYIIYIYIANINIFPVNCNININIEFWATNI